jgi:hypothetical protein
MAAAGHRYDVCDARMSLHSLPSSFVQSLLRPLHRGRVLELIRDSALSISPTWRKEYANWKRRNRDLITAIANVATVPLVVDSSKIAIRLKYLSRIEGLNVRVIQLVRDGRAVALTYMRPTEFADASDPRLRGGGSGNSVQNSLTMAEAATEWRRSNEEAAEVLATIPTDMQLRITYEGLCDNTASTMATVFDFLGVARSSAYLEFRCATNHVVGNGMRLDSGSEIRVDNRWRDVLSDSDLQQFNSVAGKLNRSFGYE